MSVIYRPTLINASVEAVVDLSRSIDLHIISTQQINETVVSGRVSGLCTAGAQSPGEPNTLAYISN